MTDEIHRGADWSPPSQRPHPSEEYRGPHEGVPNWLWDSLMAWVEPHYSWRTREGAWRHALDALLLFERRARVALDGEDGADKWSDLRARLVLDDDLFIHLVDFTLYRMRPGEWGDPEAVDDLRRLLGEAGSAWTTSRRGEGWCLERRLDETTAQRAQSVMIPSDRASAYLREAWHHMYGTTPQPSMAYRESVRAVEAAARPIIAPQDDRATLGSMIRAVVTTPQNYETSLQPSGGPTGVEALGSALKLLWKSQLDRHGTDADTSPVSLGDGEAEMALHLAATLVHWFRAGLVRRVQ